MVVLEVGHRDELLDILVSGAGTLLRFDVFVELPVEASGGLLQGINAPDHFSDLSVSLINDLVDQVGHGSVLAAETLAEDVLPDLEPGLFLDVEFWLRSMVVSPGRVLNLSLQLLSKLESSRENLTHLPSDSRELTTVVDTFPVDDSPASGDVGTFLLLQHVVVHHHLSVHPLTVGELDGAVGVGRDDQTLEILRDEVTVGIVWERSH